MHFNILLLWITVLLYYTIQYFCYVLCFSELDYDMFHAFGFACQAWGIMCAFYVYLNKFVCNYVFVSCVCIHEMNYDMFHAFRLLARPANIWTFVIRLPIKYWCFYVASQCYAQNYFVRLSFQGIDKKAIKKQIFAQNKSQNVFLFCKLPFVFTCKSLKIYVFCNTTSNQILMLSFHKVPP